MEDLVRGKQLADTVREEVQELLNEIETTVVKKKETYQSVFNQPDRVTLSTANAEAPTQVTNATSESSAYQFTINLPRPALNVKTIQLLYANIPQAQVCIPDEECVFWYYKLRTQTLDYFLWDVETNYNEGDRVNYGDTFNYESLIDDNVGHIPTDTNFWKRINFEDIEYPNINNLRMVRLLPSYYKRDIIEDANQYGYNKTFASYSELNDELTKACAVDLCSLVTAQPAGNTYYFYPFEPGDVSIVYDTNINKFRLTGNNITTPFSVDEWQVSTEPGFYPVQSLVMYSGIIYYTQFENFGFTPPNDPESGWAVYAPHNDVWNTYLVASANDPNVITAQGVQQPNPNNSLYVPVEWNQYHLYLTGNRVYYDGDWYVSLRQGRNKRPDITPPIGTPPFWQLSSPELKLFTGLNAMTYNYDLGASLFPLIVGIPGQPFSSSSVRENRTLNTRLGFTWNGLNLTYPPFEDITNYSTASLNTLLYNRLRPIPEYAPAPDLNLEAPITTVEDTYTADAFANLVYSSVINVYTRIVGGSTTDTQRNTNLLAIVPLACANLGVTFTGSFIDNPLTKMDKDIYSLDILLYTETGLPYWISNNGIATFTLKLTYEE